MVLLALCLAFGPLAGAANKGSEGGANRPEQGQAPSVPGVPAIPSIPAAPAVPGIPSLPQQAIGAPDPLAAQKDALAAVATPAVARPPGIKAAPAKPTPASSPTPGPHQSQPLDSGRFPPLLNAMPVEEAKRLSDLAFDRGGLGGGILADPALPGPGAGSSGEKRGYRAALESLGMPSEQILGLEKAASPQNRRLADHAAVALAESGQLSGPRAAAGLAAALLWSADRVPADAGLGDKTRELAEAVLQPVQPPDGLSAEERSWALEWASQLGYMVELSAAARAKNARLLEGLLSAGRAKGLPAALREGYADRLGRLKASAKALENAGSDGYTLEQGAKGLVERAIARGEMSKEQGEDWLKALYVDGLTGAFNRLHMEENLPELMRGHQTLLSFKLDNLKEINDDLDHESGNKAMQGDAAVVQELISDEGVLSRRSPTGFALWLDAPPSDARLIAEALRAAVEETAGDLSKLLGARKPLRSHAGTISLGVSGLPAGPPREAFKAAFERADAGRRRAKDVGGGNRVGVDEDGSPRVLDRKSLSQSSEELRRSGRGKELADRVRKLRSKGVQQLLSEHQNRVAKIPSAAALLPGVESDALREALYALVYLDRLSRLPNRKWFFENLPALFGPSGFNYYIALDLDRFGKVNEKLGEESADLVLAEFGRLLGEFVRGQDAVALHLSGEEFVLLSGRKIADAKLFADQARLKVQNELGARLAAQGIVDPDTGKPLELTISLGVARIEPDPAGPQPMLTLATAMSEAFLQRAKEKGRNRVESQGQVPTVADLHRALAKVLRVDEFVLAAVERLLGGASTPTAFDNAFKPRRELVAQAGFDPARAPGALLSDPEKAASEVYRVAPPKGPTRIVKFAPEETIVNELFARLVIENFELFNDKLRSPRASAFRRLLRRPVMLMEDAGRTPGPIEIPLDQKVALAVLAYAIGLEDMNPGSVLKGDWRRSTIGDFEFARYRLEQPKVPVETVGAFHKIPWVSITHLNEPKDYRKAIDEWRAMLKVPGTLKTLEGLLRRLGVPERRIAKDLETFKFNAEQMDHELRRDIAAANRQFRWWAKNAGLDDAGARVLSDINYAAHVSPKDGVLRDAVRSLNARAGYRAVAKFMLDPEELEFFLRQRQELSDEDKRKLLAAARSRALRGPDGRVHSREDAESAIRQLERLLSVENTLR